MRIILSLFFFFFNDTATTEIYTLSLHDALPIFNMGQLRDALARNDLKLPDLRGPLELVTGDPLLKANARLRSEEHTSELQSQSNLVCRLLLEKKKKNSIRHQTYSQIP